MTARPTTTGAPWLAPSPSLALAHERIAELRAAAEHGRLTRQARPRRAAWPAGLVTALRESLRDAVPTTAARAARGTQPCPTC